jgi:hypothetical protein
MFKDLFDQSSVKPKLLIYGKDRYKTTLGAIMTIISYIAVTALAGYFLTTYFARRDLNVISYRETTGVNPFIDLNDKFFMFSFKDVDGKKVDPRVLQLYPTYWLYDNNTRTVLPLETQDCTEDNFPNPEYRKIFQFDIGLNLCIVPHKYNLSLAVYPENGFRRYYNFYIAHCKNTTENGNFCYPTEDINEKMKTMNIYFQYFFPSNVFDHYNTTNPISMKYTRQNYKINVDFFYSYYEYYKKLIYLSDDGNIWEEFHEYDGHVYDEVQSYKLVSGKNTKVFVDNAIALVQFFINTDYADKHKRFYPKIQTVVANIGGVLKFVFFFARIISHHVSSQMMYVDLSNSIIDHGVDGGTVHKTNRGSVSTYINHLSAINNAGNLSSNVHSGVHIHKSLTIVNKANSPIGELSATPVRRKSIVPRVRTIKSLTVCEALMPTRFSANHSAKRMLERGQDVIMKFMSSNYVIKVLSEFERLKKVVLNERQHEMFKMVKFPQLHEHLVQLHDEKKMAPRISEEMFANINLNCEINTRLIKLLE